VQPAGGTTRGSPKQREGAPLRRHARILKRHTSWTHAALTAAAHSYYFPRLKLGEPRQGAERPQALDEEARRGDPSNLIQLMLA
jgi:hypothetical protein